MQELIVYRIYGHVQGVGFRQYTLQVAQQLGVKGWVRNRRDGSVECLAQAEANTLAQFKGQLQKGSASSQVDQIQENKLSDLPSFSTFQIESTGD